MTLLLEHSSYLKNAFLDISIREEVKSEKGFEDSLIFQVHVLIYQRIECLIDTRCLPFTATSNGGPQCRKHFVQY